VRTTTAPLGRFGKRHIKNEETVPETATVKVTLFKDPELSEPDKTDGDE
jgi:hypothetical protein